MNRWSSHAVSALLLIFAPPAILHQATPMAQDQQRGTLKGTVTFSRGDASADETHRHAMLNRYPPNALEFGIQVDPRASKPYRLSETTVIYLESEETHVQGRYTPPSRHAVLDQTGLKFHPQVLPILAGTTVDFPNGDPVFHNVFSYSQSREFDLGRYPMGDSRSVTFSLPGVVRVYCDIHADMNATILVLDNPYFATPNDEGSFTIPNIPAGRYRLNVWHGRDVAVRRTVVITSGETTTVSFTS